MTPTLTARMEELTRARVPFVRATVVRAQEPASARAGDRAVVLPDGSVEGFVGGQCAAESVRTAALAALRSGDSVLLRVLPGGGQFPEAPGASVVVNPCLSGGALEIYLEPLLPPPVLHVVGGSPVAQALAELAPAVDFAVTRAEQGAAPQRDALVVVATHGGDEAGEVRRALEAGAAFVGVVCSRTRGAALLADLGLAEGDRERVHVHVGLDIGARTAAEIALAILAELVRTLRTRLRPPAATPATPVTAVDPVCGMTVTVTAETPRWEGPEGEPVWFCNPRCRDAYAAAHPA